MEAVNHRPKLSVIIPLYNHERFIGEAISSVLSQSFSDFELIVINDGSTDNSEQAVRSIEDRRLRYYYQENQGAHNTINKGIQIARGDYISILNSDDVYYPTRLEECIRTLENDGSLDAVFSHIEFIDEDGNHMRFRRGAEENWLGHSPDTSFRGDNNIVLDLLAGNFLHTTSNLFCRKNIFDRIGYFKELKYLHDYEFFLRLCHRHKVAIIEKLLLKYRFHGSNALSQDHAASGFETALVLADFLQRHDIKEVLEVRNKDQKHELMAKFYNSLNTYNTDRIIMTLKLFEEERGEKDNLFKEFIGETDNLFRRVCLDRLRWDRNTTLLKQALKWQEGQTESWWRKAEELKSEVLRLNAEIRQRDQKAEDNPEAFSDGRSVPGSAENSRKRKVAIITRTKNRCILLRRAIESVLGQTFQDWIMVIVNDGGAKEDVVKVVADYESAFRGRCVVLHNERSLGMEAASNIGIRSSESDYLVIHDDDDSWHPAFLEKCIQFLESNPHPTMKGVITYSIRILEKVVGDKIVTEHKEPFNRWLKSVTLFRMCSGNVFPPISFVYRRDVLNEVGYYREDLPVLGDWEFNLRFMNKCDIFLIPEELAYYHHRLAIIDGEYSNSVVGDDSKHVFYDALLRNELLRKDLEKNTVGMGYLVNISKSFEVVHGQIYPVELILNRLKKINWVRRFVKKLIPTPEQ